MDERLCPLGKPGANYACLYCYSPHVWLHQGGSECDCSTERRNYVTQYATLCPEHAELLDTLHADTPLGKMHKILVNNAEMRYMRGSDD